MKDLPKDHDNHTFLYLHRTKYHKVTLLNLQISLPTPPFYAQGVEQYFPPPPQPDLQSALIFSISKSKTLEKFQTFLTAGSQQRQRQTRYDPQEPREAQDLDRRCSSGRYCKPTQTSISIAAGLLPQLPFRVFAELFTLHSTEKSSANHRYIALSREKFGKTQSLGDFFFSIQTSGENWIIKIRERIESRSPAIEFGGKR